MSMDSVKNVIDAQTTNMKCENKAEIASDVMITVSAVLEKKEVHTTSGKLTEN